MTTLALRVLALWILTILVAAAGFFVSLRQSRRLKLPKVYLGFFALAGLIQLVCSFVLKIDHYRAVYWAFQLAHNVLLCLISLEILLHLVQMRYIKYLAIAFLALLIIGLITEIPSSGLDILLNLSISASFSGVLLLTLLTFVNVHWTREYRLVTAGVMALLVGDLLPFLAWLLRGRAKGLSIAVQLGPVTGLILLTLASDIASSHNNQRSELRS